MSEGFFFRVGLNGSVLDFGFFVVDEEVEGFFFFFFRVLNRVCMFLWRFILVFLVWIFCL